MPSSDKRKKTARRRGGPDRSALLRLGLLALCVLTLIACWRFGARARYESEMISPDTPEDVDAAIPFLAITDVDRDVSASGAQTIQLDEAEGEVLITDGTPRILRGSLNGTVRVNAPEQTVHLLLDGADIRAVTGSAILVEDADRVIITLLPGSENHVSDSGSYVADTQSDGCIYSPCALTFNGTGSLTVTGLYQDAIRSKDRVKIVEGTYRVEAKRTAVRGNDGVRIAGGTIFLGAEENAVQTTKRGENGRGDLAISGGTLSVVAGNYAFCVEKAEMYLLDCTVQTNAVVGVYHVNGTRYIQDGCLT